MYRKYASTSDLGGGAMTSTPKTILSIVSNTSIRPMLYDFTVGTVGTPADNVMTVSVVRETGMVPGTNSTVVTPSPLDPSDPGSTATAAGAWTSEPATGVVLFQTGLNVRATFRWVAAPGGELVMPAVAQAGLGVRVTSPVYVLDCQGVIFHSE